MTAWLSSAKVNKTFQMKMQYQVTVTLSNGADPGVSTLDMKLNKACSCWNKPSIKQFHERFPTSQQQRFIERKGYN